MLLCLKSLFFPCLGKQVVHFRVNSTEDVVNLKGLSVDDSLPVIFPDHGHDRGEKEDCREVYQWLVDWRLWVEKTLHQNWAPILDREVFGECWLPDCHLLGAGEEKMMVIFCSKVAYPALCGYLVVDPVEAHTRGEFPDQQSPPHITRLVEHIDLPEGRPKRFCECWFVGRIDRLKGVRRSRGSVIVSKDEGAQLSRCHFGKGAILILVRGCGVDPDGVDPLRNVVYVSIALAKVSASYESVQTGV